MHSRTYYVKAMVALMVVAGGLDNTCAQTGEPQVEAANSSVSGQHDRAGGGKKIPVPQPVGITMPNCRRLLVYITQEDSFIGVVLFTSDKTKGGLPESGHWMEGELKPNMRSTFRLKGAFKNLGTIQGTMPSLGHVDYRTQDILDDFGVMKLWQREMIRNKPLYPLAKALSIVTSRTKDGRTVTRRNTGAHFAVVSDQPSPDKILDCRFISPFGKDEIKPLEEALKWAVVTLRGLDQEQLRKTLTDRNPAKAMLAFEQLRARKWLTDQDFITLMYHVPEAVFVDLLSDMYKAYRLQRAYRSLRGEKVKEWTTPILEKFETSPADVQKRVAKVLAESGKAERGRWAEAMLVQMKKLLPKTKEGDSTVDVTKKTKPTKQPNHSSKEK